MIAVGVAESPTLRLGVPTPLFQTRLNMLPSQMQRYGVSADGQRFLMHVPLSTETVAPITVLVNWQAAVKK